MRILAALSPFCSDCKHWKEYGSVRSMTDSYEYGRCAKGRLGCSENLGGMMRDDDGCEEDFEPREAEKAGTDD